MILRSLELAARLLQLARHAREGVEAADRHVEDRLDPLLPQPVDHIGRHAGLDRRLDRGAVGAVDEHGDRPLHRARQLEHVLQHVAVGIFEIDDDDVRLDLGDPPGDAGDVVDDRHALMPGLAQARLDDRGADAVLVDHQDGERLRVHARILRTLTELCNAGWRNGDALVGRGCRSLLPRWTAMRQVSRRRYIAVGLTVGARQETDRLPQPVTRRISQHAPSG